MKVQTCICKFQAILTNKKQGSIHDSSTVQHSGHKNVVTRAINK